MAILKKLKKAYSYWKQMEQCDLTELNNNIKIENDLESEW
jgi:hypothetical protein